MREKLNDESEPVMNQFSLVVLNWDDPRHYSEFISRYQSGPDGSERVHSGLYEDMEKTCEAMQI